MCSRWRNTSAEARELHWLWLVWVAWCRCLRQPTNRSRWYWIQTARWRWRSILSIWCTSHHSYSVLLFLFPLLWSNPFHIHIDDLLKIWLILSLGPFKNRFVFFNSLAVITRATHSFEGVFAWRFFKGVGIPNDRPWGKEFPHTQFPRFGLSFGPRVDKFGLRIDMPVDVHVQLRLKIVCQVLWFIYLFQKWNEVFNSLSFVDLLIEIQESLHCVWSYLCYRRRCRDCCGCVRRGVTLL